MGFVGLCACDGTVVPAIAKESGANSLGSFCVTVEEVAPHGCLGAPLSAKVHLRLHDHEHLEGVFDGDLVQGTVARGIVDLTSVAVELDKFLVVSCQGSQKSTCFRGSS